MEGLRSVWRRGGEWVFGESGGRLPERDEHAVVADALMAELDFHVREVDRAVQLQQREERRLKTGVDYSWLMALPPKSYEVPQLERLELEELCLKLEVSECSKVISLFRDAILNEPRVEDLIRIMRSCVIQTLEQRPPVGATSSHLTEWMRGRATSLISLRSKSHTRVQPSPDNLNDIEMQAGAQTRTARAYSMPNFSVTAGHGDPSAVALRETGSGAYPV